MKRKLISVLLAIAAISIGMAFAGPTPVAEAQGGAYVGWADYKGCDSDGLHYRLTEHAMYVNGQPDHKRFYVDILSNGNMIHQNAWHGAAPWDVYPATVMHIQYGLVHYGDAWDFHHCRFVFARWTPGGSMGLQIINDYNEWGFRGAATGHFLYAAGPQGHGTWTDASDWILVNHDCDDDPPRCQWNSSGGTSAYWWNSYGMTYPDGRTQYQGELFAEGFVDGI